MKTKDFFDNKLLKHYSDILIPFYLNAISDFGMRKIYLGTYFELISKGDFLIVIKIIHKDTWDWFLKEAQYSTILGNKISKGFKKYEPQILSPYNFYSEVNGKGYFLTQEIEEEDLITYTSELAKDLKFGNSNNKYDIEIKEAKVISISKYKGEEYIETKEKSKGEKKIERKIEDNAGLKNVGLSLTELQDSFMRYSEKENIVINGPAGSGKTNILLHRIDYFHKQKNISPESCALFCFNVGLKKYLLESSQLIISTPINIFSIDKWSFDILNELLYTKIFINYNIKINTKKYLDFNKMDNYINLISESFNIKIISDKLIKKFDYVINDKLDIHNEDINKNNITDLYEISLNSFIKKEYGKTIEELKDEVNSTKYELNKISNNIIDKLKKGYSFTDADNAKKEDITWITANGKHLKTKQNLESAENKINSFNFEFSEITFLNINSLFKDKFILDIGKIWKSYCKFINEEYKIEHLSNKEINYAIIYLIRKIFKSNNLNALIKDFNDLNIFKDYNHIFIDEFQDLQKYQIYIIKQFSSGGITIAGDITQSLYIDPIQGNMDFGFEVNEVLTLNLSHRTTLQNSLFANEFLGINNNYTKAEKVAFSGSKPLMINLENKNNEKILTYINNEIINNNKSINLIACPNNKHCEEINKFLNDNNIKSYIGEKQSWDFKKRIVVATYNQVKGLEFDNVFILGIGNFMRSNYITNKENILYTLFTRARKQLNIFYDIELDIKLFSGINPDLFDNIK